MGVVLSNGRLDITGNGREVGVSSGCGLIVFALFSSTLLKILLMTCYNMPLNMPRVAIGLVLPCTLRGRNWTTLLSWEVWKGWRQIASLNWWKVGVVCAPPTCMWVWSSIISVESHGHVLFKLISCPSMISQLPRPLTPPSL